MTTPNRNNRNWNKKMTIAEMLPLMTDAEIAANARRGGVAAIEEQNRRRAPSIIEKISKYADRILPDPDLDIGV